MPTDGHDVGDGDKNAADAYCVASKVVGVLVPAPYEPKADAYGDDEEKDQPHLHRRR